MNSVARKQSMTPFFVEILAILSGLVSGVAIFLFIFQFPAWLYGNDILLAWGWIGWLPGIVGGYLGGELCRKLIVKRFLINPEADQNTHRARAKRFLAGTVVLLFGAYNIYAHSFSILWMSVLPIIVGSLLVAWALWAYLK